MINEHNLITLKRSGKLDKNKGMIIASMDKDGVVRADSPDQFDEACVLDQGVTYFVKGEEAIVAKHRVAERRANESRSVIESTVGAGLDDIAPVAGVKAVADDDLLVVGEDDDIDYIVSDDLQSSPVPSDAAIDAHLSGLKKQSGSRK